AQKSYVSSMAEGVKIFPVKPFCTIEYFKNITYSAYNKPVQLPMLKDGQFKTDHLGSTYLVLESMLTANSDEWLGKLYEGKRTAVLSKEKMDYLKSNDYKLNYNLQIISELYFTYETKSYGILLAYFYNSDKKNYLRPFVLEKNNGQWKLSSNENLADFSWFMMIKPELFYELLTGTPGSLKNEKLLLEKYYWNGIFNVSCSGLTFAGQYQINKKSPLIDMTLKKDTLYIPSTDLKIDASTSLANPVGVTKQYSKQSGLFSNYPDNKTNLVSASSIDKPTYTDTPEKALASWVLSSSVDEKKKYSLAYDQNFKAANQLTALGNKTGEEQSAIKFDYKIVFQDQKDIYALIYIQELVGGNYKSKQSQLMKYQNDVWVVAFTSSEELKRVISIFNALNVEGLKILFSGKLSGDVEIDNIFTRDFFKGPENKIYINSITLPAQLPDKLTNR
ncbi:MAG TPA: hypothetical protein VK750_05650, partial [Cytophagaceae bacterium]|nr:hypothetical protein [Cytophagaceae bacterium]